MILDLRVFRNKPGNISEYRVLVGGECYSVSYEVDELLAKHQPSFSEHAHRQAFISTMLGIYDKLIKET